MYEYEVPAPQGWQCPVCKRVYSPSTPICYYCGGSTGSTVASTTTTGTNPILRINMDMPSCCGNCFALDDTGYYPTCIINDHYQGCNFDIFKKRMPDCPLKEV